MNKKHLLTGGLASLGILILILDGKTALDGAQTGIDLCIKTVIPSLFPFFLLSTLLTGALAGSPLPFLKPLGSLCGIPEGAEAILLTGFLGGYPTGAQVIASAYTSGQMKKEDADQMLSFCNNAGPAFLFGMVAAMFPDRSTAFFLWIIHIGTALLVAMLLPASRIAAIRPVDRNRIHAAGAMRTSVSVMATVCGWVILFRVILAFLDRWFLWMLPCTLQVAFTGILELSNGCCELSRISDPGLRFVICSGMLACGGLCVMLQTRSVSEGLSMKAYLKGKTMQTLFSLLISTSVVLKIWIPVTVLLLLLAYILRKVQKRSSNPAVVGV